MSLLSCGNNKIRIRPYSLCHDCGGKDAASFNYLIKTKNIFDIQFSWDAGKKMESYEVINYYRTDGGRPVFEEMAHVSSLTDTSLTIHIDENFEFTGGKNYYVYIYFAELNDCNYGVLIQEGEKEEIESNDYGMITQYIFHWIYFDVLDSDNE